MHPPSASRPAPRLKPILGVIALTGGALAAGGTGVHRPDGFWIRPASAQGSPPAVASAGDSAQAVALLAGVRGGSPLLCQLALESLEGHFNRFAGENLEPRRVDPRVRALIAWSGGDLRDPAVIPPLRAGLADSDPCARWVGAILLGRTKHPRARETLLAALQVPEPGTREMAALGLGTAQAREAIAPLSRALGDTAPAVRVMAAWALGAIEDQAAIPALTRVLNTDRQAEVRRAAAWALGRLH